MKIGVFCSANNGIDAEYFKKTEELGAWMARNGHDVVYGGCNCGLMETIGKAVHEGGRKAIGVIPAWLKYYNERRFHESLDNLTPRDVYLGQGEKIKKIRETIKQNSIKKRIFDNKTMKYQSK